MNIKKQVPRWMSILLSLSMAFSGVLPAYATEAIITESALEGEELIEPKGEDIVTMENNIEAQADIESRYETVEVSYSQSSSYFVTIPKTITLGTDKKSPYSIKVEGDLVANKQVCVVPVDGIEDTEVFDFYMADQITGSTKADVVAEVSQAKFYWNHEEAANGYEENDNYIIADGLSAGKWKGTFQFEISMRTDPTHIHNYVGEVTKEPTCTEAGEKTYICDCGDSYTETIDPTGHHFEKGECTNCGEKDPDHEHQYMEVVTKQPTCTEDGERTYTCDCGDSYTEVIPAMGHHYVDGECEHCGEKDPDAHEHSYTEEITKQPTCTEDGEKTYTCECGDSYTEVIPATGHNYVDGECEHCGEKDPDAHEHSYTEEITKQPTCTEDGEKTYTCECGDSYTEKIPATGHNFVDGTCTNCGEEDPCSKSHTDEDGDDVCDICGHEHTWEENIVITNWTLTSRYNATYSSSTKKYTFNTAMSGTPQIHFEVTVPDTAEFEITYYNWTSGKLLIKLDGEEILNKSYVASTTDNIILTSGTHKLDITWEPISSASFQPTIALNEISYSNHICNECGETQTHMYAEVITKEPTCTEKGEKELTCAKCGYSYIEEIPVAGGQHVDENDDDVCDKCGHKHIWEDTTDMIEWARQLPSSSLKQTENVWTLNYENGTQYSTFTSHGNWYVTVPFDVEYKFNYTTGFMYDNDYVKIYVDDNLIVNFNDDKSGSETIFLTAGRHEIQMYLYKNNQTTSATYATITLNPVEILYHICTECGDKQLHHYYTEGIIIKEPTCTEKGEKEFACTKCNGTKIEEIDALGHNYVDGVCDRCGSLNLIKKRFWSAISSTSETEDTGGGHNDMAILLGTYSPNIEITEDMRDGEYLLLDFYVRYPFYGGAGHYGEVDGINGQSMLQKYDEETGTWETIYSYGLSYSTVGTNMAAQEGGYTFSPGNGIMKSFQLEKGTYRAYGRFSAGRGCGSSVAHYYYTYFISVDLCRVEKEAVETP